MIHPDNIIVGNPMLIDGEKPGDVAWEDLFDGFGIEPNEVTIFWDTINPKTGEIDLHLPRILVANGFFKGTGQVRRATPARGQPPFVRDLKDPEFTMMKIGRRHLCLIVGMI